MLNLIAFAVMATALARGLPAQEGGGPVPSGPEAADGGFPGIAAGEILVIGETHGSNEIPHYVLEQVRREARRRPVTLGLEIAPTSAALDCRRGDPRRLPAGWTDANQDGRTSRAMRALICGLRAPGLARRVRLVFLDDVPRTPGFDERAARRFRQAFADRPGIGLVLTGNFHARNNEGSLAAHLRRLGSTVRTATTSAAAAETWICAGEPASCGAQRSNVNFCSNDPAAGVAIRWYPGPGPRFAWDYCLSMPRLTPSAPAMANEAR